MAMAKLNRFARFYGADNDRTCAMMTVVNLTLNAMYGEVAWMNTLTQQWYGGWLIEPTISGAPRVRQISEKESYIKLNLPAASANNSTHSSSVTVLNSPPSSSKGEYPQGEGVEKVTPAKQLIFEF